MFRLTALAVLPLAASGAMAQNIQPRDGTVAQYAEAHAVFGGTVTEFESDPVRIAALLPQLVGNWFPIDQMLAGAPDPGLTDDQIPSISVPCRNAMYQIALTSPHGFTLTRKGVADTAPRLVIRYSYVGFNAFQGWADENQILAFLGLDTPQARLPLGFHQSIRFNDRVNIYLPSPDILVFVNLAGAPQYFARCP